MARLAVIGCVARAEQYRGLSARIDGKFVAWVNQDRDLARAAAGLLGATLATASLDELLEQHADAFDAVLIHSANGYHQQQAERTLRAGKHVLVDNPLALSTAGADEVLATVEQGRARLMLGQGERFVPSIQAVQQRLASGQLGQPGLLRIHRWEARTSADRAAQEREATEHGGTLPARLSRDIDLACWLLEGSPTHVYALGRNPGASGPAAVWDFVQLHLGFAHGAMALIDYTATLPAGDDYYSLSVIGSQGAAYADDHQNMQLLYRGGSPAALKTGQGNQHRLAELREFLASIQEDREPSPAGRDGRRVLRVAEAAEESISTEQAIHL